VQVLLADNTISSNQTFYSKPEKPKPAAKSKKKN
jgi:hypothetical protein